MQTLRVLQNFLEQKSNVDMHLDEIRTLGNPFGRLTHRELEILGHLVSGIRNQEIALRLKVSDNTISTFKKRIFEKTGAKNIAQLIDLHHTFHSRSAM
jgi:DNA-binding CsgD family transcriptional regulator